jgi:ABC-type multidrug transport system ATPase subunit
MLAPSSTPTEARSSIAVPAVRVEELVKTFGAGVRALDGITLCIPPGELVALVGPNGSGKSTLLEILYGITAADAGDAQVLGLDPRRDHASLRPQVGYAGQETALDLEMTGHETLRLFYALRSLPHRDRDARLARLSEEYDIDSFWHRPVGTYSGGERQRLHLALEAMHEPRLLLLDEPTVSLDPAGRRALWNRLVAWRDAGRTLLVATHDLAEVATYCDRVVLLDRGHLLADDAPQALIAAQGRACTEITLACDLGRNAEGLVAELRELPEKPEVAIDAGTITLWRARNPEGSEPALDLLASRGISYLRVERAEPDLASVYFRLAGKGLATPAERNRGGKRRSRS